MSWTNVVSKRCPSQLWKVFMPGLDLDTFHLTNAYFEQSRGSFQKVNLKAEHRMNLIQSVGRLELVVFNKMCQKSGNKGLHWSDAMGGMIKTL